MAYETRKNLNERIAKTESPPPKLEKIPEKEDASQNMSQLSISGINPPLPVPILEKPHIESKDAIIMPEDVTSLRIDDERDFGKAKQRYEKRIELLEKQIDELKMENILPAKKYKQIRDLNPIEEAFDEVVNHVKGEIFRRKCESLETSKNASLKGSKSQPGLQAKNSISAQTDIGIMLKDFTDTDKV